MESTIKNVHHIGYLVKNITDAVEAFKMLGYSIETDIFQDEDRKAAICFLVLGDVRVELVSPRHDSEVYPLLKKYKNAPYHICYEVDNLREASAELQAKGFLQFIDKARAQAISPTANVVFLMNAAAGMVELLEKKD
jgi:methylmalonyl-CoA/ethylmalonyl-CoA epimerase